MKKFSKSRLIFAMVFLSCIFLIGNNAMANEAPEFTKALPGAPECDENGCPTCDKDMGCVYTVQQDESITWTISASDPDGDALTISMTNYPTQWSTFAQTPNTNIATWEGKPLNIHADDSSKIVSITVNDGKGGIIPHTFTLIVKNVNDAPQFTSKPLETVQVLQDLDYSFNVDASDVDMDIKDNLYNETLTYALSPLDAEVIPNWLGIDSETGQIQTVSNPTNADVGTYRFEIQVQDSLEPPNTIASPFTIQVLNKNDAPVIDTYPQPVEGDWVVVNEKGSFTAAVFSTDIDNEIGANNILTYTLSNAPSWLTTNSGTGDGNGEIRSVTYRPNNSDVGEYPNIEIIVTDNGKDPITGQSDFKTDSKIFNLKVINVNDPPKFTQVPPSVTPQVVKQDEQFLFDVNATDVDIQHGDSLTYALAPDTNIDPDALVPNWLKINQQTGEIYTDPNPTNDDVKEYQGIQIQVTDESGEMITSTFTLIVQNVNDAPALNTFPNEPPYNENNPRPFVLQDAPYSFQVVADDIDLPLDDKLTFTLTNNPVWLKIDPDNGLITTDPIPGNNEVKVYEDIVLTVTDNLEPQKTDSITFALEVINKNDKPEFTKIPPADIVQQVNQDRSFSFQVSAKDIDAPYGDTLTYAIANNPAWLKIDETTGLINTSPNPTNDDVNTYPDIEIQVFDQTARDAGAPSITSTFTLEVKNVNDAPTISGTPDIIRVGGENPNVPFEFQPTYNDVDPGDIDNLFFWIERLITQPVWLEFDNNTGKVICNDLILKSVIDGYEAVEFDIVVTDFNGGVSKLPVTLMIVIDDKILMKANFNLDGILDLADAILGLQILTGINPDGIKIYIGPEVDLNGDGKIGMEEIIYILQFLAGMIDETVVTTTLSTTTTTAETGTTTETATTTTTEAVTTTETATTTTEVETTTTTVPK